MLLFSSPATAVISASWRACGHGRAHTWTAFSGSSLRPSLRTAAAYLISIDPSSIPSRYPWAKNSWSISKPKGTGSLKGQDCFYLFVCSSIYFYITKQIFLFTIIEFNCCLGIHMFRPFIGALTYFLFICIGYGTCLCLLALVIMFGYFHIEILPLWVHDKHQLGTLNHAIFSLDNNRLFILLIACLEHPIQGDFRNNNNNNNKV